MRKITCIYVWIAFIIPCSGQPLPEDIQQRLDKLRNNAKIALDNFRTHPRTGELYSGQLRYEFTDPEYLWEKSHKYNLNLGMIYDDEMRNRLVQLMQNGYREDELDTLVNRLIDGYPVQYENYAMEACKFDTLPFFKAALDSFYLDLKNKSTKNIGYPHMHTYEVFKLLKLDTTEIFKRTYSKIRERERERERERFITKTYYNHSHLAELCGYIGDKRFIPPLIEALDKPDNFNREVVIEALARMRAEPYYSEYVKFRMPRTLEQIKQDYPGFEIDELVYVIGTQEAFLELSKYLLSDVPYAVDMADYQEGSYSTRSPISDDAFFLIRNHMENEDLQELMKNKDSEDPIVLKQTYDWMQKNYGKYKIKRIW
ncbi:MAG: hypothetical protein LBL58_17225 [Tannerellaceae bacterium]|jgi:hypothetical protein|nr:hypothetical protein [Tannerellaceae bacterium]